MTNRGELPPRRHPFAFDNGAFVDWRKGRPFDESTYLRQLDVLAALPTRAAFMVAPDVVAGGLKSLEMSVSWLPRLRGLAPVYLAVQDGMRRRHVAAVLDQFDGIFVGGSLDWKLETGAAWVAFAHRHQRPCHVGRVGTAGRVRWARAIGADSIDSCLPLWSTQKLNTFRAALAGTQLELTP